MSKVDNMTHVVTQIYANVHSVVCDEVWWIAKTKADWNTRLPFSYPVNADTEVTEFIGHFSASLLLLVRWRVRPRYQRSAVGHVGVSNGFVKGCRAWGNR